MKEDKTHAGAIETNAGTAAAAHSEDLASEWVRLYRGGLTGAGVAAACEVDDIMAVLKVLAEAKRQDPSLEAEHTANLRGHALDVEQSLARQRALTPAWRRRIAELTAFVAENGRMPRQIGGDSTETALGRWMHAQRSKVAKGTLEPRQRAALDAVGNWDSNRRASREEAQFPDRLNALATFRAHRRRLPSYWGMADPQESALGTWLQTLRQAAAGGRLPDNFRQALDEAVPDWQG